MFGCVCKTRWVTPAKGQWLAKCEIHCISSLRIPVWRWLSGRVAKVLLQPRIARELHFFAFARAHPRTLDRHLLSGEHQIALLLPPAHAVRRGVGMVTRPHAPRHFVLDHTADDLQSRQPSQALHLRLQLFPYLDQRQRDRSREPDIAAEIVLESITQGYELSCFRICAQRYGMRFERILVAAVGNTTSSPGGTASAERATAAGEQYRWQRTWSLVPRSRQGPLRRAFQCLLQIARTSDLAR